MSGVKRLPDRLGAPLLRLPNYALSNLHYC